ncbi:VWA domain-containing protein [Bacillus sp. CGMCC 1.16607]|uniref:vWA domain-containing protein n=1 Tax=Bacillus sp. CGMCC 1.16607 TaxID=3351842 RepID=UPI00363D8202
MFKKIVSGLFALFLIYGSFTYALAETSKQGNSASRIEGVLVVDVSNSMKDSDKNKVSNEAMKMFIDMASLQGDKIGVVAYTDEVIREKALVKMRTTQDKKDLKDFVDSLGRYPYTDISVGVKEAVRILDAGHEEDYFPLIVLLADGNNDLKKRTAKESNTDLKEAISSAKANGYPIYTIGLNADGKLNKEILKNIAADTNGKFFETSTADRLPEILSSIFADHLKLKVIPIDSLVANGNYQDIKIDIPNENVLEANISMISSKPVDVKLIDPTGKEQTIPSDKIMYSKSKSYSMLKLINPIQGEWTLKVKGVKEDKIDINLVFNYDLQLKLASLPNTGYKSGDTVKIEAFFDDNGHRVNSKELYQSIGSTLLVKDIDKGSSEEIKLTPGDNGFTGQFTLGKSQTYEIQAKAEDNSFYRETEKVQIKLQTVISKVNKTKSDPEKAFPWTIVVLSVLGLLLLAGMILFVLSKVKQANRGFSGQMVIEIKDEDTGERSNPQYKKLNSFKGKVRVHQLLSLAPEFSETNQLIIKPGRGDALILLNESNCTIEKSGRAMDASKGLEVKRNDRLRIVLKQVNKSIYIEYIS